MKFWLLYSEPSKTMRAAASSAFSHAAGRSATISCNKNRRWLLIIMEQPGYIVHRPKFFDPFIELVCKHLFFFFNFLVVADILDLADQMERPSRVCRRVKQCSQESRSSDRVRKRTLSLSENIGILPAIRSESCVVSSSESLEKITPRNSSLSKYFSSARRIRHKARLTRSTPPSRPRSAIPVGAFSKIAAEVNGAREFNFAFVSCRHNLFSGLR